MPEKAQPVVSNDIINTIKKKQILEEIVSVNPTIQMALLELIWDSVREMDDRKLKQLRKGNLKIKNPIKRPVFEDGQILTGCCEIKENDIPNIIDLKVLCIIIISAISACLLGALIPCRQAARLEPVKTLQVSIL